MIRPGLRNSITDIAGTKVGNAEDRTVRSGVTVIALDEPAVAVVDVRGSALKSLFCPHNLMDLGYRLRFGLCSGTREPDALTSGLV